MAQEIIIQRFAVFIAEKILKQPTRSIRPDEPLITSGLIDSFSLIDLALFAEENFGVQIDDIELTADTFDSLLELADIIEQRQNQ